MHSNYSYAYYLRESGLLLLLEVFIHRHSCLELAAAEVIEWKTLQG